MGRSKALMPVGPGGPTFVRRLAETLRTGGVLDLLVVGRPHDDGLRSEVSALGPGVRYVENPRAETGQISSIVAAIDAIDRAGVRGLLVLPVDQPLLSAPTVAAVLESFTMQLPPIARAVHRGRHGHPVIFSAAVFDELRLADPAIGARVVLRAHVDRILDVEVDDEGAVLDIDDPEQYARVFGVPPPAQSPVG
jgi:CTP:molybdopterin cytidylyltransferase MocA